MKTETVYLKIVVETIEVDTKEMVVENLNTAIKNWMGQQVHIEEIIPPMNRRVVDQTDIISEVVKELYLAGEINHYEDCQVACGKLLERISSTSPSNDEIMRMAAQQFLLGNIDDDRDFISGAEWALKFNRNNP